MSLKDDLNNAVSGLGTAVTAAVAKISSGTSTGGSVDDTTVQNAVTAINAATTSLNNAVAGGTSTPPATTPTAPAPILNNPNPPMPADAEQTPVAAGSHNPLALG